jgi:pimeloyl-ACP methyl ester carboxylesterase
MEEEIMKSGFGLGLKGALMLGTIIAGTGGGAALAAGEAGPIALRDQGFFYVGVRPTEVEDGMAPSGQMYVGFQLVADAKRPYPLVLVHGGGGQSTDWMGTPDGRDGWLDYFLADGFDVYFVDRPGYGRSPNSTLYGELQGPTTFEFIANRFTAESEQYPGGGGADTVEVQQHVASSNPGPTIDNALLQENLAEMLDKIGPAILVTHSAGGPSGWLALEARPDLVKGILAIETAGNLAGDLAPLLTWEPALVEGETIATEEVASEGEGLDACNLQPADGARNLPNFAGVPIMGVVAPNSSMFAPSFHCTVRLLEQAGADVELVRLEDKGIMGNGHFMNEDLNNDVIAKEVFIPFLASIE